MTLAEAVGWHDYFLPKLIGSLTVSYAGAEIISRGIWNKVGTMPSDSLGRRFAERYMPHHGEIGTSMLMGGVMAWGKPNASPLLIGSGIGLVVSDWQDVLKGENRLLKTLFPKRDLAGNLNKPKYKSALDGMDIHLTDIPDWAGRRHRYEVIANVLQGIVNDWSYNRKRDEDIPPACIHPIVVTQARKILRQQNIDGRDTPNAVRAIQKWTQENIGYVYDPRGTDYYMHPYLTLQLREEDCDGHALVTSSMLKALDIPARMVMIAQHSPDAYNHIYTEAQVNGQWVPLETTRKVDYGYQPANVLRRGLVYV